MHKRRINSNRMIAAVLSTILTAGSVLGSMPTTTEQAAGPVMQMVQGGGVEEKENLTESTADTFDLQEKEEVVYEVNDSFGMSTETKAEKNWYALGRPMTKEE